MLIDWEHFTPWLSLLGGILIGMGTAILLLFNGRIAGISGIIGGLLQRQQANRTWRILFLLGLMITPIVYQYLINTPPIYIEANWVVIIIAGILVGVGTRLGGGCTSGHGVCGISRLSMRSLFATFIFVSAGMITVFCVRHILGV